MQSGSPTAEDLKRQQAKHWNGVAGGWAEWLEWTERNFRPITEWFSEAGCWPAGARALDVACGAGYPALVAAPRLRPGGSLLATDISSAMIAAAVERAGAAGLRGVDFLEMDAEDLQFEDGSFDAVTNAYGLMFCPDPQRAVDEAFRVLKPGGRFALATWDDPSKNPFFTVIFSAAASTLSLASPAAGAAGPFRLAAVPALESMLRGAGFSAVQVHSRTAVFECMSVEEYRQLFTDVAWKSRIAALTPAELARFQDAVRDAAQPFTQDGRVCLTATSLCASAQKA